MALPAPQFIDALVGTLEDPANQTPELATALRDAADTYSETETDQKIQEAIDALPSTGDVTGPAGAVVGNLAVFDDVSGKVLADSLVPIVDVEGAVEKTDFLTVTAATDLDAMRTRVNELDAALVLKGTWDASGGSFPGSGTAQAGDSWIVSTGGTVDGAVFTTNDRLIAIVDNASTTTFAANWFKADYTDAVLSINGQTGAVTIEAIVHAASSKATPVDADEIGLVDSAASNVLKKLTWANLKTTVRSYFLGTANQYTASQRSNITALTIGANTAGELDWTLASGNDFSVTANANFVWNLPSDIATYVGQSGFLIITQDGTGGRTMSVDSGMEPYNSDTLFDIATGAGEITLVSYKVVSASVIVLAAGGVGVVL